MNQVSLGLIIPMRVQQPSNTLLSWLNFMFLHDTLVWLAIALDAVLEFAVSRRKLSQYLIKTWNGVAQGHDPAETDHISPCKTVAHHGVFVRCPHVGTCVDVVHSLPHALQRQSCSIDPESR
jgi:hypothetical protein